VVLAVYQAAAAWGADNPLGWRVFYTELFDRAQQYAKFDINVKFQKHLFKNQVHDNLEYISMLLNLQLAVQCESWVSTLASNFARVIDEMRVTVGAKANRAFADLSAESCENPPCIGSGLKILWR
jgi:hypothetical protein